MSLRLEMAYDFPRQGLRIRSTELREDNVYIHTANGDVWRVWIDFNDQPLIECVASNVR